MPHFITNNVLSTGDKFVMVTTIQVNAKFCFVLYSDLIPVFGKEKKLLFGH